MNQYNNSNNFSQNNFIKNQNGYNTPPLGGDFVLSNRDIDNLRHKAEIPFFRIQQVVNILFIISVIAVFIFTFSDSMSKLQDVFSESMQNTSTSLNYDYADKIPASIQLFATLLIIVPYILFVLAYFYGQVRSRAVKITPRQFPEIYDLIIKYSYRLNLKEIPEAYIVQENGILNAFSSFVIRKKYIQINADLFEVAYREYHDIDSIGFVLAHEMAHIKLKHASLPYQLWILWASVIPFLSQTSSRTREYSCDRLAQIVSGSDGIQAMMALTVGKHLYKRIDVQDYIDNSIHVNGFFVGLYNLLSTHPILPKRIKALVIRNKSGDLF